MARTESECAELEKNDSQGKNAGKATVSPYTLSSLLYDTTGTMRVLLYTLDSDNSSTGEVENTMNAIKLYKSNVTFDTTKTISPVALASELAQADVFVVPEQEKISDLSALGAVFASVLTTYVNSGGTIVVLDYFTLSGATTFLNGTGLMTINIVSHSSSYTAVVNDASSPLVEGVPSTFTTMDGSNCHTSSNGVKIIREQLTGNNIVTQRNLGAGRVIYMGWDFNSYNNPMARILSNAITSSQTNSFVFVDSLSGTLAAGLSKDIVVKLKPNQLPLGEYRTTVTITGNDPLTPVINIPVHLTVGTTGVGDEGGTIPEAFALDQNYPNPFNPSTTIKYALPERSIVKIEIFNILGQTVAQLVQSEQEAGYRSVVWMANVSTGIYFYRIDAVSANHPEKKFMNVKKMLLMK